MTGSQLRISAGQNRFLRAEQYAVVPYDIYKCNDAGVLNHTVQINPKIKQKGASAIWWNRLNREFQLDQPKSKEEGRSG